MGRPRARRVAALVLLGCAAAAAHAADQAAAQALAPEVGAAGAAVPSAERMQRLLHMVRQDCGSCHGMRLTGGLGPALTPDALAGKPVDSLAATIYHGRPGTPMPGWRSMLTAEEARWIAQQLLDGLPDAAR
ncbi:MAG: c-type cytochrome [Pseudomonadota bacterium]